ncbi:MAG: DUF2142 domain-containing protein [Chloroflexi bacterium]|nr:DUF2142 domain-containing protein [Chloroflexota bacterium]
MLSDKVVYPILGGIVALHMLVGLLYAANTPPWQNPDEPAHYNVIAQIAVGGCCPVIATGDWDAAALTSLVSSGFPEGADVSGITYEDHQPPLYYLALAPVFLVTGGSLSVMRIVTLVMGAGIVVAAYFVAARLFPRHRIVALALAAFVGFVPQHLAMVSSVNNDALAWLALSILMVVAVGYVGNPTEIDHLGQTGPLDLSKRPHAAALGGITGVGYLIKLTVYLPMTLLVAAAILLRWRQEDRAPRWAAGQVGWAAGMAILFGLPLWVRNVSLYGWPDLFALGRHDEVVEGQLRTADLIAEVGTGPYLVQFARTTFQSFWGQFGWMAVPLPVREYVLIGAFLLVSFIGLVIWLVRFRPEPHPAQRAGLWLLAAVVVASLLNYGVYNLTFVQFQGRYLFTLLIPFGLAVVGGWHGWSCLLAEHLTGRVARWLPLAAVAWMPLFAVWSLVRHIIPNLS